MGERSSLASQRRRIRLRRSGAFAAHGRELSLGVSQSHFGAALAYLFRRKSRHASHLLAQARLDAWWLDKPWGTMLTCSDLIDNFEVCAKTGRRTR
jgi:hypothetical protein